MTEYDWGATGVAMKWDYRVFEVDDLGESSFVLREVYYKDDQPYAFVDKPAEPYGISVEDLKRDLEHMVEALNKPVLRDSDFDMEG